MKNEKPISAAFLSLSAAGLILAEGVYTAVTQSSFAFNWDVANLLFYFAPGLMLALCGILLLRPSRHNRVLGIVTAILALWSVLTGGGFLVGAALGVISGVLAFAWKSKLVQPLNMRLAKMPKKNRLFILLSVVAIAAFIVMPTEVTYQLGENGALQQALAGSKLVDTSFGPIEYADAGVGYPVLVSHGAGMGYLQIDSVKQIFGASDFRFIVPSRFGYIRSPMEKDSSFAAQADAFAELLNALNISKVIIMGISIGGPVALEFALRHPRHVFSVNHG